MTRALEIWRGWSTRQRIIAVGSAALVLLAGVALALFLAFKRPGDVVNPDAAFVPEERERPQQARVQNWTQYGNDNARTRYMRAPGINPPFKAAEWSFQAGKLLEFSPIVVNQTLYFMDKDALFRAVDGRTGRVEWRANMGALNASAPTFSRGRLFGVNLEPGQAFSLRAHNGSVAWIRDLPGRSESSPVVYRGRVIVGVETGDIYAFDRNNGRIRWHLSTEGEVKGGLALHEGTLYVGNYAGEVLAIDAASGNVRWRNGTQGAGFGRTGRIYSTPAVAFGRVYLGSIDGRVYSFEAESGELAWSHSTGDWVYAAPAVADTPNSPPTVYIGSVDQNFYALDARDGSVRWQRNLGAPILGAASVINDTVYVSALGDVGTFGFRTRGGRQVWKHELGRYNPVISDGRRLYLTGASAIRAFEPRRPNRGGGGGGGQQGGGGGGGQQGGGGRGRG